MRKIYAVLTAVVLGLAFNINAAPMQLSAQPVQSIGALQPAPPDSIVQLTAEAQGLALVAPADLPKYGTYWLVMPGIGGMAPLPCPPDDPSLPVYQIADGQFLVDATGGQVAVNPRRFGLQATSSTVASALAAEADAVVNLISQVQAAQFNRELAAVMGFDEELDSPGTFSPMLAVYDTNALWLEIIAVTNHTASLVIHPPWNVTNEVYDLLYCTNLAPPSSWPWLLRSGPGQTNLTVANATDAQGFYRLGPPNDLTANDSLGTNFWLAFFHMDTLDGTPNLSLYISSPVGATGTVTTLGVIVNSPLLIVTNCGDASVNGPYVLTQLTPSEETDWANNGALDPAGASYVYGTHWVNYSGGNWLLFAYDSSTGVCTLLYSKTGVILKGSAADWGVLDDTNGPPKPTTLCEQVPFSQTFSVAARAVTNISLPPAAMMTKYDVVETNGIHITASQPVSVYGLDYDAHDSAAFTGYPTPLLGTNYCVMARAPLLSGYGPGLYSQLAIVATASNTAVNIRPSPAANLAGHANAYAVTNLQPGQTYQINSRDDTANSETNDVTGTWITSDKPIAVFAGADAAFVPYGYTAAGNPLVQEQLPVDSWGRQALALGFAGRLNGDSYRVLAAYTNTVVWTNGWVAGTNQAGQFLDLIIAGPVVFQGSQPIQVAHFANGHEFGGEPGDPCEILLPPTGHYLLTNIVYIPTGLDSGGNPYDFTTNYVNLIVAQSAMTNTLVDGSHIATTNFVAIGTSGYSGARVSVTNGVHRVSSSQPVGVEVYGFGIDDAYGYFGGVVK